MLVKKSRIHGDYVRIPGHSFMLLAYDPKIQKAWTIEGNYGNRVVLTRRSVQSHWSLGNLVPEMLREEES